MTPLSAPRLCCCARKYARLLVAIRRVSAYTRGTATSTTSVSRQSSTIISVRDPKSVSALAMSCVVLEEMVEEMLSTSLARRLIVSPWEVVSKKPSGRRCIFLKNSPRMTWMSFWLTRSINTSESVVVT